MAASRIYLDNAATSWPKPESVYQATDHYLRDCGAAAGRGLSSASADADRIVQRVRQSAAELMNASTPESVLIGFNGTDVLNLALFGAVGEGDHVVTTDVEHNSVLRPLRAMADQRGIEISHVACNAEGFVEIDEIRAACRPNTKLISLIHASNVTGAIQPLADASAFTRERGIGLLVDAAQSAGHVPIDLQQTPVDLLATSGHKGLLGPLGTGLLVVAPAWRERLRPFRYGGTGTHSDVDVQPSESPQRFESGNPNLPGLAGLAAGLDYVLETGVSAINCHEIALARRLVEGLRAIDGVRVIGDPSWERQTGVVSFTVAHQDPRDVATLLDQAFGIECRAGYHCAPRVHRHLGTDSQGGTIRFSPGPFTTDTEIDTAIDAIGQIVETESESN